MGVLVLLLVLCSVAESAFVYKRLAGPSSEFEKMRLPSPLAAALTEDSALLPVKFLDSKVWDGQVAVDSAKEFQLVLYSPQSEKLRLDMFFPNGSAVPLSQFVESGEWPISSTGQMVGGQGWRFEGQPRGFYKVRLSMQDGSALPAFVANKGVPNAYLMLWNDSPEKIFSHLGTYDWEQGRTVGITAHLFDSSVNPTLVRGQRPSVLKNVTILKATLDIYQPDGVEVELDMEDDGTSFDLLANDGVYGAKFTSSETGMWRITALFEGTLEDGTPFMRSAEHGMVAVADDVNFNFAAGPAVVRDVKLDSDQMSIFLPTTGPEGRVLRAYAEVYGTEKSSGKLKAVCWIGGYTAISNQELELELNKKWLVQAGVEEPLVLRNVYVSNQQVHVPQAEAKEWKVVSPPLATSLRRIGPVLKVTEEMLKGVRPPHLYPEAAKRRRANSLAAEPSLVLVHGYCAQDNPWTRTNPIPFTDYAAYTGGLGKSVPTSEFAQDVIETYDHLPSWGLVAHSQGGMVSAEVHNFYWTPNDAASTGRPIQSMGTPYYGVSGAGAALDLGSLFGIGCGENFDLTTDGANLWLAGIQSAARTGVYFYTTFWKETFLHPRYCNLAVNLVLKWPNDGTTEYDNSQLEGATAVSHTEGECHTTNMKWPPQTQNLKRNAEINAAAAR